MKNEIKIISKGTPDSTKIFVGGKPLAGVLSCEIGKIESGGGPITANLVVYVDTLEVILEAKNVFAVLDEQ